jgi:hypothetical protein
MTPTADIDQAIGEVLRTPDWQKLIIPPGLFGRMRASMTIGRVEHHLKHGTLDVGGDGMPAVEEFYRRWKSDKTMMESMLFKKPIFMLGRQDAVTLRSHAVIVLVMLAGGVPDPTEVRLLCREVALHLARR